MTQTAKVTLYDRDDTMIADLDTDSVQVAVNRDSACRRTASFTCGSEYRDLLRVMGRRVRVKDVTEGIIDAATPTFARSSVAYNSETGEQVAANQPRFVAGKFGKAVMVEEGTTNLVSPTWNPVCDDVYQTVVDTGETWFDQPVYRCTKKTRSTAAIAVYGPFTIPNASAITVSMYAYNLQPSYSSTYLPGLLIYKDRLELASHYTDIVGQRTRIEASYTNGTGSDITDVYACFFASGGLGEVTKFGVPQVEKKPYATSFVDGIRATESLLIPTDGVVNPIEGTIEVRVIPSRSYGTNHQYIFDGNGPANKSLVVYIDSTSGLPTLVYGDGTAKNTITSSGDPLVSGTPYAIAWQWSTSGIALLVDDDPVGFLGPFIQEWAIDMGMAYDAGTSAPSLDLGSEVYFGSKADGSLQLDGVLDDVRISSRARSQTEILEGYLVDQPLPVDEWTTYKLPLDGTLAAQSWEATEEQVFDGYIDSVAKDETSVSRDLVVSCRDKAKKYLLAGFEQDTTYEDLTAADTQRATSSVSATSNIAVGDEIQRFGVVYKSKLFATVLGVEAEVAPSSVSGDILSGTYSTTYTKTGLTGLRLEVGIDLRALEAVTAATIATNGAVASGTLETSQDGLTWTAYADGTSFRYLRFDVSKAVGPITLGVTVTTSAAYVPANITIDGVDSWRPSTTDLDRMITLDLGSALSCNVLYLRWGISSLDKSTVFTYLAERSLDNATWTTIGTYTENASYLAEHVFDAASLRYLRITVLSATNGLFALRFADLRLTVSTVSVDTTVDAIADTEGETLFALVPTRRFVAATTFEAGGKKWEAMRKSVEAIGHELYYSRLGVLTSKPRDRYSLVDAPIFDNPFALETEDSDDEVYNQVIAVYEAKNTSLRSVRQDTDALSPTSIPNVGTRTAPIIKTALADTQAKLDGFALAELQRLSRRKIAVGFEDVADPTLEAGDVIRIREIETVQDGYYVVESFTLLYGSNSKTMTCEVTSL